MLPSKPNPSLNPSLPRFNGYSVSSGSKSSGHPTNLSYSQLSGKVLEELFDFLDTKKGSLDYNKDVIEYKNTNGIYIINKQKPTEQIWLSSPISGPKRFSLKHNQFFNEKTELIDFIKKELK